MARDIDVATKDPPTVCIVENDTSLRRGLVRLVRGHRLTVEAFAWPGQVLRTLQAGQLRSLRRPADHHRGRWNTKAFDFNRRVDKYVLKPIAKGYNFVVPDEIQTMIANGFDNISFVPRFIIVNERSLNLEATIPPPSHRPRR